MTSQPSPPQDESQAGLGVPVLFVVFNRPDTTRAVFESIRRARPTELFVAADGPRPGVAGEQQRCLETRTLATNTDWPCTVRTLFRERNAGLALSMSTAISWFFDSVSQGIVLEDDCVPASSFYRFCAELLAFYDENPRVMHVSGDNFQYGRKRGAASYYFSAYAHCWGWATWRRAWQLFSFEEGVPDAPPTVWAKHWELSIRQHDGVSILPNANLVTNIGFGRDATHTSTPQRYSFLPSAEMKFPLVHPASLRIDPVADKFTYYVHFRSVRFPRLVWLYEALDAAIRTAKRAKRRIRDLMTHVARVSRQNASGKAGERR